MGGQGESWRAMPCLMHHHPPSTAACLHCICVPAPLPLLCPPSSTVHCLVLALYLWRTQSSMGSKCRRRWAQGSATREALSRAIRHFAAFRDVPSLIGCRV